MCRQCDRCQGEAAPAGESSEKSMFSLLSDHLDVSVLLVQGQILGDISSQSEANVEQRMLVVPLCMFRKMKSKDPDN